MNVTFYKLLLHKQPTKPLLIPLYTVPIYLLLATGSHHRHIWQGALQRSTAADLG